MSPTRRERAHQLCWSQAGYHAPERGCRACDAITATIEAACAEARREAIEEAARAVDAWAVGWRKVTLDYANGVKHRIECENKVEEIERYVDAVRRLLSDTPAPPREPTP